MSRFIEGDSAFVRKTLHPNEFDVTMLFKLPGLKCFEAKRGYETDIQLDFTLNSEDEKPQGTRWLSVVSMWHMGGPRGMLASSSYTTDRIDGALEHLLGRTAREIELDESRGVARINFDEGVNLNVFFDTSENANGWSLGQTIWEVGRQKGREILLPGEAYGQYGKNGEEVAAFINRLAEFPWLQNVGRPHSPESRTLPVKNWQEAIKLYGTSRVRTQRWKAVIAATERIAAGDQKHPLLKTCFSAWNTAKEVAEASLIDAAPNIRYWIITKVALDAARAAHELAMGHLTKPPRYYRDLMRWYEEGHWPCETTEDGYQFVF